MRDDLDPKRQAMGLPAPVPAEPLPRLEPCPCCVALWATLTRLAERVRLLEEQLAQRN